MFMKKIWYKELPFDDLFRIGILSIVRLRMFTFRPVFLCERKKKRNGDE